MFNNEVFDDDIFWYYKAMYTDYKEKFINYCNKF